MKINKFDKVTMTQMRAAFEKKMAELEAETGVKFTVGRMTYQENTFKTRVEAVIADKVQTVVANKWNANCWRYGLSPEDRNKTFRSQGEVFTAVDIEPRKYRRPIICVNTKGQRYVFPADVVKAMVARNENN